MWLPGLAGFEEQEDTSFIPEVFVSEISPKEYRGVVGALLSRLLHSFLHVPNSAGTQVSKKKDKRKENRRIDEKKKKKKNRRQRRTETFLFFFLIKNLRFTNLSSQKHMCKQPFRIPFENLLLFQKLCFFVRPLAYLPHVVNKLKLVSVKEVRHCQKYLVRPL